AKAEQWTDQDWNLANRVHTAIRQANSSADAQQLIKQLRQQRLAALEKHFKVEGKLPAVRRLIVIPAGLMAAVPVEVLASEYVVSYAPSATLFARSASKSRSVRLGSLVALGDPVFERNKRTEPPAPKQGLLLRQVLPGGNAARAGLRAGDVLLVYNGVRLF